MTGETYTLSSLSEVRMVAIRFLATFKIPSTIAFYGGMGAGKTTLIKALCHELNVTDTVTSPTFSIINEYKTTEGKSVYHFDFYRIEKIQELIDIGVEEYFYRDSFCFIEWPEIAQPILPENVVEVVIEVDEKDGRRIRVRK